MSKERRSNSTTIELHPPSTTTLNNEYLNAKNERQLKLPTFFKWFKKTTKRKSSKSNPQYLNSSLSVQNSLDYDSSGSSSSNKSLRSFNTNEYPRHNNIGKFKKFTKVQRNHKDQKNSIDVVDHLSPSQSCDSVLSTSTTGFAFIQPNNYEYYNGHTNEPKLIVENETNSNSLQREFRENVPNDNNRTQLNFREKYKFLYCDSDTIKSSTSFVNQNAAATSAINSNGVYDNIENLCENNLEIVESDLIGKRRSRRTVSDSSKDIKSGAYVHVKGKRKAPLPPPPLTNGSTYDTSLAANYLYERQFRTLTPVSTLVRKKRKAPPPPLTSAEPIYSIPKPQNKNSTVKNDLDDELTTTTILSEGLLDDKDIKAILEGQIINSREQLNMSAVNQSGPNETEPFKSQSSPISPISPTNRLSVNINDGHAAVITPRPWYKRSIMTNRDSVIPFKREIALRTMEKRRNKEKNEPILPDVNYTRSSTSSSSSIFDLTSNKFGIFSLTSSKDDENKTKDQEKRRSGIGMPNISELDREAIEIINKEKAGISIISNDETKSAGQDHLILQQKMFEATSTREKEVQNSSKQLYDKTTRDNCVANQTSPMKEIRKNNEFNIKLVKEIIKLSPTYAQCENLEKPKTIHDQKEKITNSELKSTEYFTKMTWTCPICTLENPNWRIICEVCERLKPYEKITEKFDESSPQFFRKNLPNTKKIITDLEKKTDDDINWEKKTEIVKKYFQPQTTAAKTSSPLLPMKTKKSSSPLTTTTTVISKSASETSVNKKLLLASSKKSPSPSRLPVCNSPKLNRIRYQQQLQSNGNAKPAPSQNSFNLNCELSEEKEIYYTKESLLNNFDVVTTTVTPVFFAQTETLNNDMNNSKDQINLDEIRNARLAKFQQPKDVQRQKDDADDEVIQKNDDVDALEREKQRLRDKIRAMNAKALAEKYPLNNELLLIDDTKADNQSEKIELMKSNRIIDEDSLKDNQFEITEVSPRKLGAIKKVYNKPKNLQINASDDNNKPKKISSSAQTSRLVKKQFYENLNNNSAEYNGIYTNVPIYENHHCNSNQIETECIGETSNLKSPKIINVKEKEIAELNKQLESTKETLKNQNNSGNLSRTDTLVLNKIMKNLEVAIFNGKHEVAAKLAMDLAKMKVSLQVTKTNLNDSSKKIPIGKNQKLSTETHSNKFSGIDIPVEGSSSQRSSVRINVKPSMIVGDLKLKVFKDFNIPINVQNWKLNEQILHDNQFIPTGNDELKSLKLLIVDKKNCAHIPETSKAKPEEDNISDGNSTDSRNEELNGPIDVIKSTEITKEELPWRCKLCTLINPSLALICSACNKPKLSKFEGAFNISNELKEFLNDNTKLKINSPDNCVKLRLSEKKNDLNKINPNRKSSEMFNIIEDNTKSMKMLTIIPPSVAPNIVSEVKKIPQNDANIMKKVINVSSPNITKNKYRGVDNFNPYRKDSTDIIPHQSKSNVITNEPTEKLIITTSPYTTTNHYMEILKLTKTDIVKNAESFDCPICFQKIGLGDGCVLRDCLHTFCKECLSQTIKYSDDVEVKCPFANAEYTCSSALQDREIRSLVSNDLYEKHLAKSVQHAEHQIENAFHCKTPNCRGWCIYEDNVNQFKCPVCRITNCLTCRVIHDGLTCKQYQDRLNSNCDSNLDARQTKEMLNEMIDKGEALNCPTCQVIMMKKWGCDWIKCSMCKTEVCWVTRGPRWGPAGKGDTSGGCKCGVNGVKCHQNCNYCH